MADIGGLIRGALSGAQQAVAEVLIQYRADTTELDKALAKVSETAAKETQIAEEKSARLRVLQEREQALQQQYYANYQQLIRAQAMSTDAEVASLTRRREVIAAQIQQSQVSQASLTREIDLLAAHRAQLTANTAALKERQAASAGGVSAGGAAAIGAVSAVGTMIAMQAVMALGRAVQDTMTAYVEWGHAVEHTSGLLGTNAENASVLLYTFQRVGLTTADADRTIIQLSRHVEENEEKFRALGVQTRNTDGQFRSAYDIFQSVRGVLSQTADGVTKNTDMMELLARASSGGGQSFAELNQILSLTDAQMALLERDARAMGFVLSDEAAKRAFQLKNEMNAAGQSMKGLQISISQWALPALQAFTDKAIQASAAIGYLIQANGSFFDKVGGYFGVGPLAGGAGAAADRAVEDARKIGEALDALDAKQPPDLSNAAMKAGRQAETEAIREQIQALRDAAQAREDEMRAALTAYEREHERAIQTIQDTTRAREAAHNDEIRRIQDEQRARDDAFNDAEEQRRATIDSLRQEVQAREQALQMEEAQWNLQQDEKALARERLDTTSVRGPRESIEDFYKRRYEAEQKLAKDTHKVLIDQKKIELDQFKAATDAQIRGIEAVSKAARETNENAKRDAEKRIEAIRKEMELEKRKSEAQIEGIRNAMQAERDKVEAAIKNLQRETQEQTKELEKRLKALEAFGSGAAGAIGKIGTAASSAAGDVDRLNDALNRLRSPDANDRIAPTGGGQSPDARDRNTPGGVFGGFFPEGFENFAAEQQKRAADQIKALRAKVNPYTPGDVHDFPHSFIIPEPTMLLGASGKNYGTAAASGPERIAFGGVGGDGGHGHDIYISGRKVAEALSDTYTADAMYGRRS